MIFEEPSSEPQHNVIMGVPVVTIPLADYAELLDQRRQFELAIMCGLLDDEGHATLFARDPEVAVFVATRFGLMTPREMVADIYKVFGEDRVPLQLSIIRFWTRFRQFLPPHVRDMAL